MIRFYIVEVVFIFFHFVFATSDTSIIFTDHFLQLVSSLFDAFPLNLPSHTRLLLLRRRYCIGVSIWGVEALERLFIIFTDVLVVTVCIRSAGKNSFSLNLRVVVNCL